jgi:hypothetical protein
VKDQERNAAEEISRTSSMLGIPRKCCFKAQLRN